MVGKNWFITCDVMLFTYFGRIATVAEMAASLRRIGSNK